MRYDLRRPECENALANLWEYLDAELDPRLAPAISAHLEGCGPCRGQMLASRRMLMAVRATGIGVRAPAELWQRVLAMTPGRH